LRPFLSLLTQGKRLNRIALRSNRNRRRLLAPTVPVDEIPSPVSNKRVKTLFVSLFAILVVSQVRSTEPLMKIEETPARITMMRGENIIFHYNKEPTSEASDHAEHYTRTGYIHPIYSPSGRIITGDYAKDHPHQHGLFFAWTKTTFEGRKPEFWNQKLESGRIAYRKTLLKENGAKRCSFTVEHLFEDLTAPKGPKPVIKEIWKVTGIDQGDEVYLFEIESTQTLIATSPITIEKYHYGGMALRGTKQWYSDRKEAVPPGTMQTDAGLGREEGNHSRPHHVTMHGPVEDGHAGITVFSDPKNFRAPQWVRLHPSKPYFVYAPMVEEPFQITEGKPYISRYRYLVFDGPPEASVIKSQGFAP